MGCFFEDRAGILGFNTKFAPYKNGSLRELEKSESFQSLRPTFLILHVPVGILAVIKFLDTFVNDSSKLVKTTQHNDAGFI